MTGKPRYSFRPQTACGIGSIRRDDLKWGARIFERNTQIRVKCERFGVRREWSPTSVLNYLKLLIKSGRDWGIILVCYQSPFNFRVRFIYIYAIPELLISRDYAVYRFISDLSLPFYDAYLPYHNRFQRLLIPSIHGCLSMTDKK